MRYVFAAEALTVAALYWGTVLVKVLRFRRRRGRTPVLIPGTRSEQALLAAWIAIIAVWFAQPIYLLCSGPEVTWLSAISALDTLPVKVAGTVIVWPAYLASLWAWRSMGRDWRLGLDKAGAAGPRTSGAFAVCRHPIYTFQAAALLGTWLILPTPALLTAVATHALCVWSKSRIEERHMIEIHGDEYVAYRERVGAFLPWAWRRRTPCASPGGQPDRP